MPLTVSSQVRQLSDGNASGTVLGTSSADQISFYGATPQPQASGGAFSALVRGQQCGVVGTFFFTATPSRVGATSTLESGLTTVIPGTATFIPQAGDLIYVNKPTAQAGIGLGNVRVSTTNSLGVTFNNFGSTSVSPTAGETYRAVVMRGFTSTVVSPTPAVVPAATVAEQMFTVAGLRVNEVVQVMKPSYQAGLDVVGCRVAAANTLGITYANVSTAAITPTANEGYTVWTVGGLDATNNEIYVEENLTGANSVVTVKELSLTVTGITTQDAVLGITKPSAETTVFVAGARVSAANTVAVTYGNTSTTAITPSSSGEVYGIKLYRPNPIAPCVVYSQTLTPVSIAASTTAEQSFSVTGLQVNSPVWVNKPTATPGLGIVGTRTSAANNLYITYANNTSNAITPPAETYLIANFQIGGIDTLAGWIQSASPQQTQAALLLAALRNTFVSNGLTAGS